MAGSSPHQASSHQAESANVYQPDDFLNLERKRDRENYQEGSVHTIHTGGSGFWRKGHVSHEQNDDKAMQREIDDLKKQLCRAQQKRSPSSSDVSSNDEENTIQIEVKNPTKQILFLWGRAFSPKETQKPFS